MNFIQTEINDLLIVEPGVFYDTRGYFYESFNLKRFNEKSLVSNYVQDNQSKSEYGVIRGLHYQLAPDSQTKLVRVLEGKIFDVAVDIRIGSPTYGKWFGMELSCDNKKQLYIPKGFAHGFSVLSEKAVVFYKCDNFYSPDSERGINIFDSQLNIDWKIERRFALVSDKDKNSPEFSKAENNLYYNIK
jgi:dTDP-4-dehydrorhamnose 3,5-epimerase